MLLFPNPINLLIIHTNRDIEKYAPNYRGQCFTQKASAIELKAIKAILELLSSSAVNKDNRENITVVFNL